MRGVWIVGVLASAIISSQACATPVSVEYRQETLYNLTYHMPGVALFLDEHQPTQEFNFHHYDAHLWDAGAGYSDSVRLLVKEGGLQPLDLSGVRLDLSVRTSPIYPINDYWGFVEFGSDGDVQSWDFWYAFDISTAMHATSEASTFDASAFWAPVHDAWLVDGKTTYDSWWWEPTDYGYATRPGHWSVDVSHACYRIVDGTYDGDVPCVAPVPLPLPGLLLAGSMAGLIALGRGPARRRSRSPATRRPHPPARC